MVRGVYKIGITGEPNAGIYVGDSTYDGDVIFFNEEIFMIDEKAQNVNHLPTLFKKPHVKAFFRSKTG